MVRKIISLFSLILGFIITIIGLIIFVGYLSLSIFSGYDKSLIFWYFGLFIISIFFIAWGLFIIVLGIKSLRGNDKAYLYLRGSLIIIGSLMILACIYFLFSLSFTGYNVFFRTILSPILMLVG